MKTQPVKRIASLFVALCGAAVRCMLSFLIAGWSAMRFLPLRVAEYEAAAYYLIKIGVLTAVWQLNTVANSREFAQNLLTDLFERLSRR